MNKATNNITAATIIGEVSFKGVVFLLTEDSSYAFPASS